MRPSFVVARFERHITLADLDLAVECGISWANPVLLRQTLKEPLLERELRGNPGSTTDAITVVLGSFFALQASASFVKRVRGGLHEDQRRGIPNKTNRENLRWSASPRMTSNFNL